MLVDELSKESRREIARNALRAIMQKNGGGLLKPEDVLDEAAHPDHPLHREFEWDDSVAAHHHRMAQARTLIRSIPVVYVADDRPAKAGQPEVIKVRKYHSLPSDRKDGGGYREVDEIVSDKNMLDELLETAKHEVDAVLRRYEIFKELGESVRAAMATVKPKARSRRGNGSNAKANVA